MLLPTAGSAQLLTFGFQGGAPAQVPLGRTTVSMPFVLGPTLTVRLFSSLSLESGLLFYRLGEARENYAFRYPENSVTTGSNQWRGLTIEIPFLLKHRFLSEGRVWQPFVSAGPTIRRTSMDFTGLRSTLSGSQLDSPSVIEPVTKGASTNWNVDPAAAAGISFRAGRFRLEPEVRYSYWGAGKNTLVRKNQVHFLLRFPLLDSQTGPLCGNSFGELH